MDDMRFYRNYLSMERETTSIIVQKSEIHDSILKIDGYKHSMVQVISLAIALRLCIKINNPPLVSDTYVFADIVKSLGGRVVIDDELELVIDARYISNCIIPDNLGKLIHGSMYLCPALLMSLGSFDFFGSGGCQIGSNEENNQRPIGHILSVMSLMGAHISQTDERVHGELTKVNEISEIDIMDYSTETDVLSGPLVGGATKVFLIMSLRNSYFVIRNAYLKTDVMDMIRFLEFVGKKIRIHDGDIYIEGHARHDEIIDTSFMLTQCISEIITYSALSIAARKKITFRDLNREIISIGLQPEFDVMKQMGIIVKWFGNDLSFYPPEKLNAVNICVMPRTIQSDHHPFFALLLLLSNNESEITENVWKDRFRYAENLKEMGADMQIEGNRIRIKPSILKATVNPLSAFDVRSAAVTLLAIILSNSSVELREAEHISRGYSRLSEHLSDMGVQIRYVFER